MNAGCHMFIGNGKKYNAIYNLIKNKIYTHFIPKNIKFSCEKKVDCEFIEFNRKIFIDQGAAKALNAGKSLLAAGIIKLKVILRKVKIF